VTVYDAVMFAPRGGYVKDRATPLPQAWFDVVVRAAPFMTRWWRWPPRSTGQPSRPGDARARSTYDAVGVEVIVVT
jgi:hypothetical protein